MLTSKTVQHLYQKTNIGNGSIWGQYMGVMAAIYTITEQMSFTSQQCFKIQ